MTFTIDTKFVLSDVNSEPVQRSGQCTIRVLQHAPKEVRSPYHLTARRSRQIDRADQCGPGFFGPVLRVGAPRAQESARVAFVTRLDHKVTAVLQAERLQPPAMCRILFGDFYRPLP